VGHSKTAKLDKNKEEKTVQIAVCNHQEREESLKMLYLWMIQQVQYQEQEKILQYTREKNASHSISVASY